jgi:hypothetical protein
MSQEVAQLRAQEDERRREMEHAKLASAQEARLSAAVQVSAVQEESSAQYRSHQSERQALEASLEEARKRIRYMQSEQQRELVAKVSNPMASVDLCEPLVSASIIAAHEHCRSLIGGGATGCRCKRRWNAAA